MACRHDVWTNCVWCTKWKKVGEKTLLYLPSCMLYLGLPATSQLSTLSDSAFSSTPSTAAVFELSCFLLIVRSNGAEKGQKGKEEGQECVGPKRQRHTTVKSSWARYYCVHFTLTLTFYSLRKFNSLEWLNECEHEQALTAASHGITICQMSLGLVMAHFDGLFCSIHQTITTNIAHFTSNFALNSFSPWCWSA